MFGFMQDVGNYKDRKVDRYEDGDLFIDTCRVSDSTQPYETGIAHPAYNDDKIVIVEQYANKEEAQAGHNRWIEVMTAETLPSKLQDVSGSTVALLLDGAAGEEEWRTFERK